VTSFLYCRSMRSAVLLCVCFGFMWMPALCFGQSASTRAPSLSVTGSPGLGRPFVAVRAFPLLTFQEALDVVPIPGMNRWAVVERRGTIWSIPRDDATAERAVFADMKAMDASIVNVFAVQFHPQFKANRFVFMAYAKAGKLEDGSTLSRFTVTLEAGLPRIDYSSELKLLHWRSGGHNGGAIQFGNDGLLYLSTGDSEVPSPPDPLNTGQDLSDLLSSILRIDVDKTEPGRHYAIPPDNPFLNTPGARPEIWAFGFRNPWKMAFDRKTGSLWVGDVGWELWEMVHLVTRGGNYGWAAQEGGQSIKPETRSTIPITLPVIAHPHSEAASITGGFIYRGQQFPELVGAYVYGDYETGRIWALWHDGKRITRHDEICQTPYKIVTFGEAEDGELVFSHYAGESTLHRLVRNPEAGKPSAFPLKLSGTGLFADVASQSPAEGVLPYGIHAPMWSDGASAQRFVALPEGASKAITAKNKKTTWANDTVFARTVSMEMEHGQPQTRRKLETQLMHFNGISWAGYSYRWNDAGTDADLVGDAGDTMQLLLKHPAAPGGQRSYEYRFHSRSECMRCHTMWTGFLNGFQPQQLQDAERFVAADIISADYLNTSPARLVEPSDESQQLEARARSWLHANCAHCHRQNGGGSVSVMLNAELPLEKMLAINHAPQRGTYGIEDGRILAAGSPGHSVLLHRIAASGAGHMPIVGARETDVAGLTLLSRWVEQLAQPAGVPEFPRSVASATDAAVKQWMALAVGAQPDLDESFHVLLSDSSANALRLLNYIDAGDAVPSVVRETLARTDGSPNGHVRALYERFQPEEKRQVLLSASPDEAALLAHSGDVERGKRLFEAGGKASTCLACHFMNGVGRDYGPDLTHVGSRLDRAGILTSVVKPSAAITDGFQAVILSLKDGSVHTGFIPRRDEEGLEIKLATGQSLRVLKQDIQNEQRLPVSLMPEGLLQAFTAQEAADLLAYLASLK
jgi:putative heme-binding domain-containing protein